MRYAIVYNHSCSHHVKWFDSEITAKSAAERVVKDLATEVWLVKEIAVARPTTKWSES